MSNILPTHFTNLTIQTCFWCCGWTFVLTKCLTLAHCKFLIKMINIFLMLNPLVLTNIFLDIFLISRVGGWCLIITINIFDQQCWWMMLVIMLERMFNRSIKSKFESWGWWVVLVICWAFFKIFVLISRVGSYVGNVFAYFFDQKC